MSLALSFKKESIQRASCASKTQSPSRNGAIATHGVRVGRDQPQAPITTILTIIP